MTSFFVVANPKCSTPCYFLFTTSMTHCLLPTSESKPLPGMRASLVEFTVMQQDEWRVARLFNSQNGPWFVDSLPGIFPNCDVSRSWGISTSAICRCSNDTCIYTTIDLICLSTSVWLQFNIFGTTKNCSLSNNIYRT